MRLGIESLDNNVHTLAIISCRVSTQPSHVHLEARRLWVSNSVFV